MRILEAWCKHSARGRLALIAYSVLVTSLLLVVYSLWAQTVNTEPPFLALYGSAYDAPQKIIGPAEVAPGGVIRIEAVEKCNRSTDEVTVTGTLTFKRLDDPGSPPVLYPPAARKIPPQTCISVGPFGNVIPAGLGPVGSTWEIQAVEVATSSRTGEKHERFLQTEPFTIAAPGP